MEQNNLKEDTGFLSEVGIVLRRGGYDTSVPDNGLLPVPDLQQRIAQAQPQEESAFTEPTM